MKRSNKKRSSGRIRSSKAFFRFIIIFSCVLVSLGLFYIFKSSSSKECANSISCIKDLTGNFEGGQTTAVFMGNVLSVPSMLASLESLPVLGDATASNKRILIDLSAQKLYAKEGDTIVHEFLISSGKWGQTPTGDFKFWIKLRYTRMRGGKKELGTYYDLPNVPYVMYFYNDSIPKWRGYGIHGAYWHNNFGHPMSHGCINMRPEDAGVLYNWAEPPATGASTRVTDANPGTPITIYGVAPNE